MRTTNPLTPARRIAPILAIAALVLIAILSLTYATSAKPLPSTTSSTSKNPAVTSTPDLGSKGYPDGPIPTPTGTACALAEGGFESGTLNPYVSEVAVCEPGGCGWVASTTSPHSGNYAAFGPGVSGVADQRLVRSAAIPVFYYGTLQFFHSYSFETDGPNFYDGGVLEASTDNGSNWADMGPNITSGGYNGTISSGFSNPLAGRSAWVGNSGGYTGATINLVPYANQSLLIRFREGNDSSVASDGWHVDEIYSFVSCVTYTPLLSATPTYTNTPIPTDTETSIETPTETPTDTGQPTNTPGIATETPGAATETPTPTETPISCTIEFADVLPGNTFYNYVHCIACQGIIVGYPCGGPNEPCNGNFDPYFRPSNNVTRGQLAKIVSESANFTDPPLGQTFEDVPVGSTPYTYTERLASRSVMSGYACGGNAEPCVSPDNRPYFRPGSPATRGQLTKIISNAAGLTEPPPVTHTFTDVPVGSTFHQYVESLLLHRPGAMNGYQCGLQPNEPCDADNHPYFRPNNLVTRGQTSKIDSNVFFPNCEVRSPKK